MLDDCVCHGLGVQECGQVLAIAGIFLCLAFTVWWGSFQVESILKQNWGEQPCDVGCELETLCVLYVAVSILLSEKEPASAFLLALFSPQSSPDDIFSIDF